MDAIVTAGGIPQPEDPLYEYANGAPKALLDVAGKPMIQWTLDAISGAKNVENVVIVGMDETSGISCTKPTVYLPNQGRMLANIVAGVKKILELNPSAEYALIVSSDIPGLKSEMIDWLIETAMQTHDDVYYGVVPREVMETRYPGANRTYTRLKDIEVCGADINIAHVRMATEHLDMWENLIGKRKSPLKQAASIGYGTLLRVLFHQITLDDLVATVTRRLGITGRAIVWDKAEPAMDVDKPHQLEILRADLAKQIA
jgi:GTP:adenosylcobinamide-phosphate guanylyltransferase